MASIQNFRSALNGFNRDDVIHYLEYSNGKHEQEVAQLNEQIAELQVALDEAQSMTPAAGEENEELVRRIQELETENEDLRTRPAETTGDEEIDALRRELEERSAEADALRETVAKLTRDLEQQEQHAPITSTDEELAAYRRAERTERLAQNRASQLYDLANGVLSDSAAELDVAVDDLKKVTEDTLAQIQTLQLAVAASKNVFTSAKASLMGIRPTEE